jgi:hypothetical protein
VLVGIVDTSVPRDMVVLKGMRCRYLRKILSLTGHQISATRSRGLAEALVPTVPCAARDAQSHADAESEVRVTTTDCLLY